MNLPFDYHHVSSGQFLGTTSESTDFERARVVILPVPLDRTTTYVAGTRNGPHEILAASSHLELWDEETACDVHSLGICTLPDMELPFATMEGIVEEIRRVSAAILEKDKFLIVLGGEHSITPPVVAAAARQFDGLSVLQIDAHADLRDSYIGTPHNHACAMRRVLEHARATQVGIRSLSPEEASAAPTLQTTIFYDISMRRDPQWMDRVVESLAEDVYITIDVDGLDPAIMPSTGTPEPGGLGWYETLALLKKVIDARRVVACDVVELSPTPGLVAPNFLCAKLVYKILSYRFGNDGRSGARS